MERPIFYTIEDVDGRKYEINPSQVVYVFIPLQKGNHCTIVLTVGVVTVTHEVAGNFVEHFKR